MSNEKTWILLTVKFRPEQLKRFYDALDIKGQTASHVVRDFASHYADEVELAEFRRRQLQMRGTETTAEQTSIDELLKAPRRGRRRAPSDAAAAASTSTDKTHAE